MRCSIEGAACDKGISYSDLAVRDWGVAMAYFTFDPKDIDKSMIDQDVPYFRLETVKSYSRPMATACEAVRNTGGASTPRCKTMCRRVSNGGAICHGYECVKYIHGFSSSAKYLRILRPL